jgi:hypothetical protein
MGSGMETVSRYLNQSMAHLLAFVIGIGLPLAVLWLHGLAASVRAAGPGDGFALATSLSVLLMAFSSLFSMEVERVWIYMVPLLALVAARPFGPHVPAHERVFTVALALGAVQLLAAEAFVATPW